MSRAFELAKSIVQAEEIVRLSKPVIREYKIKNDAYFTEKIPLSVQHDCYSILIPTYFKSVNHMRIDSCSDVYSYRINHGDWVDVDLESEIVESGFDIESIDIKNGVGTDTLKVYLEGISNNMGVI